MKKWIVLLSAITTASIHSSITEKINKSKKQLAELRTKVLKGEKLKTNEACNEGGCSCDDCTFTDNKHIKPIQ